MNKIQHVSIIMDGNGRWANMQKLSRARGHRAGAQNAFEIIRLACQRHIPVLSLFAFSKENWGRPPVEVHLLMRLLARSLEDQATFFSEMGIQLKVIGDREGLPSTVIGSIARAEERTRENQGLKLIIAVNYSGQYDICQAVQRLRTTKSDLSKITPADFQEALLTNDFAPPDLIIRTGGENRLSNFFLWQAAYSEIHFEEKYWPDFMPGDLDRHLTKFMKAQRRYGKLNNGAVPA